MTLQRVNIFMVWYKLTILTKPSLKVIPFFANISFADKSKNDIAFFSACTLISNSLGTYEYLNLSKIKINYTQISGYNQPALVCITPYYSNMFNIIDTSLNWPKCVLFKLISINFKTKDTNNSRTQKKHDSHIACLVK